MFVFYIGPDNQFLSRNKIYKVISKSHNEKKLLILYNSSGFISGLDSSYGWFHSKYNGYCNFFDKDFFINLDEYRDKRIESIFN